jgi:hypothetical protein
VAAGEQGDERAFEQRVLPGDHAPDLVRGALDRLLARPAVANGPDVAVVVQEGCSFRYSGGG